MTISLVKPGMAGNRISAFVVRCLDSIMPLVSIAEISSLYLASVAAQVVCALPRRKPRRQFFS